MVIIFEEKDREIIETKGMLVVEFKQKLYKLTGAARYKLLEISDW